MIFNELGEPHKAKNINAYLVDGPNICIESRSTPISDVPRIGIGNKPIDDGNYLFTLEEKEEFILKEPKAANFFHPWYGSQEFIHNEPRYCLWLGDCSPAEIKTMPNCLKRVEAVRNYRLNSPSEGTRKLAETPTRFHVENMPKGSYVIIPRVSSEKRAYIPIGYLGADCMTSDSAHLIPSATLYHFGVLTSSTHNSWMRAVCGRLKSDYRYSKDIVYNNFVWPEVSEEQRQKVEKTAQAILDARALYPDSSLADLYDETLMPPELRKAHRANDEAVLSLYGLPKTATEGEIVSHLIELYVQATK